MIPRNGKNRIRDLIANDITSGEHGTDSTAPSTANTDLGAGVSGTSATPTVTKSDQTIHIRHLTPTTAGNGSSLYEYGVFMNTNVLLDRVTYPVLNKTNTQEIHTINTMRIV